tara:strand:+ start:1919 stop:2536 length:618 start_codon:yes stop_codon:yes gene_type:complete
MNTTLMCFSYACSAQPEQLIERVKYSNKILLPPSILHELRDITTTMLFKITNAQNSFGQVCGVQEFTAPPGVVLVPYHVMEGLGLSEGNNVNIELSTPPDGSYIKLQPHKTEFIDLPDPKALLEKALSVNYPVVTEGHTITIQNPENNKVYHIDIVKTEPSPIIKIIDVNVNVDFEAPLDYVPPPIVEKYDEERFPGKGHKLGSS